MEKKDEGFEGALGFSSGDVAEKKVSVFDGTEVEVADFSNNVGLKNDGIEAAGGPGGPLLSPKSRFERELSVVFCVATGGRA